MPACPPPPVPTLAPGAVTTVGSVVHDVEALGPQASEVVEHALEDLRRVGVPALHLVHDAHRLPGAVRPGHVAREALVRDVGVVFERAERLHHIDACRAPTRVGDR